MGERAGDRAAAIESFRRLGETAGDAMANALTLIDGLAVIGGGLSGAASEVVGGPASPATLQGLTERLAVRLTWKMFVCSN